LKVGNKLKKRTREESRSIEEGKREYILSTISFEVYKKIYLILETSEKLFHAKSLSAQMSIFKLKYDFACPPFHYGRRASLREYLFFDFSEISII
jgi:hypothetical protein